MGPALSDCLSSYLRQKDSIPAEATLGYITSAFSEDHQIKQCTALGPSANRQLGSTGRTDSKGELQEVLKQSFAAYIDNMQVAQPQPSFMFQPTVRDGLEGGDYLLPPIASDKQYTLVLDLDETLVHYEQAEGEAGRFMIRPYARQFLQRLSEYYEIVIFTAAVRDYADFIIDELEVEGRTKHVSFRLYREHTSFFNNIYHKVETSDSRT